MRCKVTTIFDTNNLNKNFYQNVKNNSDFW